MRHCQMNAIGKVRLTFDETAIFDPYEHNRSTGSFILIDPDTNNTVAGGMILGKRSDTGKISDGERVILSLRQTWRKRYWQANCSPPGVMKSKSAERTLNPPQDYGRYGIKEKGAGLSRRLFRFSLRLSPRNALICLRCVSFAFRFCFQRRTGRARVYVLNVLKDKHPQ